MSILRAGDCAVRKTEPNKFFPIGQLVVVKRGHQRPLDGAWVVQVQYTTLHARPLGVTIQEAIGMESQWWGAVNFAAIDFELEDRNEPL